MGLGVNVYVWSVSGCLSVRVQLSMSMPVLFCCVSVIWATVPCTHGAQLRGCLSWFLCVPGSLSSDLLYVHVLAHP